MSTGQLEQYRIVRSIGRGGMGEVLEAEHAVTGRRVAIKTLLPHVAQVPALVQRFLNEARAATMIGHRGIVEILDAGVRADGTAFVVMEMLLGESLVPAAIARPRLGPRPRRRPRRGGRGS